MAEEPTSPTRNGWSSGTVHLRLINGFSLAVGSTTLDVPPTPQRLWAYLGLYGPRVSRPVLASAVWPDKSERRAEGNLRSSLWRLPAAVRPFVQLGPSEVRLARCVRCDVREESDRAQHLIRTPTAGSSEGAVTPRVLDVTPLKGDVLPGWYDDWVLFARERYRQLRVRALEILSAALCGAGLYADAIEMALSAIEADPLRESSHRALINVCIAEGNPADAIREFESYRGLLARELGVSPSRAIEKLVEPLRAG